MDGLTSTDVLRRLHIEGDQMEHELDKTLLELAGKILCIFKDFMMRTAKFEELVDVGHRFLVGFYQELEMFKRPPLNKKSNVVENVIEANRTDRMKAYIEAECRHPHLDVRNISNLHSCEQGLQDHLKKVKNLLDELCCLKEDAIGIAKAVNHSASHFLERYSGDDARHEVFPFEKEEEEPALLQEKSISYTTLMMAIYGMLRLDCDIQEHIIKSLSLKSTSAELESYCLMWDLRPYINDSIMHLAWRSLPE